MAKKKDKSFDSFGLKEEIKKSECIRKVLMIIVGLLVVALIVVLYILITKTNILDKIKHKDDDVTTSLTTTTQETTQPVIVYTKEDVENYLNNNIDVEIWEGYNIVELTESEINNVIEFLNVTNEIGSVYHKYIYGTEAKNVNLIENNKIKNEIVREYLYNAKNNTIVEDITKNGKVKDNYLNSISYKSVEKYGKLMFKSFKLEEKKNIDRNLSDKEVNFSANVLKKYEKENEFYYLIRVNDQNYFDLNYNDIINGLVTIKADYIIVSGENYKDHNYLTGLYYVKGNLIN